MRGTGGGSGSAAAAGRPGLRANLWTLGLVAAIGAVLAERLHSPGFLMTLWQSLLQALA